MGHARVALNNETAYGVGAMFGKAVYIRMYISRSPPSVVCVCGVWLCVWCVVCVVFCVFCVCAVFGCCCKAGFEGGSPQEKRGFGGGSGAGVQK